MKQLLFAAALAGMASTATAGDISRTATTYDPTFFAGLTWSIGNGAGSAGSAGSLPAVGFTLKYLSTNEPGTLAASVGISYFLDGSFGCDAGFGLNEGGASIGIAYDFCRSTPTFSFGVIEQPDDATLRILSGF